MGDAPARKEVLDGCRGENCCSIACDLLGDSPPCEVLPQDFDDVVGVIFSQLEDTQPV